MLEAGCFVEQAQAFDLGGLGKHVERNNALDVEDIFESGEVAGKGRWVARNVDDPLGWCAADGLDYA